MLAEILKAFKKIEQPLDLNELSQRLGTERSALEGMLEMLVRQGKLKEIDLGSHDCAQCNSRFACHKFNNESKLGKVYELVEKPAKRGGLCPRQMII